MHVAEFYFFCPL